MSDLNGNGSWLSPKTISQLVLQVGVPSTLLIFLLLVLTGIIPTPLMNGLQLIPQVVAQHLQMREMFEESVYLQRVDCQRKSTTLAERQECVYKRSSSQ